MGGAPDVVIVGGGVIGSSIAYHLAARMMRVVVVDTSEPAVAPSASWASAGGVRQQGRDPREWPLARKAARRWPTLQDELGADLDFRAGGHLHVVESDEDARALEARVSLEREGGLDVQMVFDDDLRAIAPGIKSDVRVGAYSARDGQASPIKTTRAFAAAAMARGAQYRTNARRVRLLRRTARMQGVVVDDELVSGACVVVAAGAWSPRVAADAGVNLPVAARAPQMLMTGAAPPSLVPTITATRRPLSLKQLPSGEFLIGGGWPSAIDSHRMVCHVLPQNVEGSWQVACTMFPSLGSQRVVKSWCGLEGQSIDAVPLIGPLREVERLYVAVGFSGHGFQLSPAVGAAVADALAGKGDRALAPLSPSRVAHIDPAAVRAFMTSMAGDTPLDTLG